MSGITCAQWLRRKVGIEVYKKVEGGNNYCVIQQNKRTLACTPDDTWATLCVYTVLAIFRSVKESFKVLKSYPAPTAAMFLTTTGFKVKELVHAFDFEEFERNILPTLLHKTNYGAVIKDWELIKEGQMMAGDDGDLLEVFDWIVRLRLLMRAEKGGAKVSIPGSVKTDVEQLGQLDKVEFARITMEHTVGILQTVHATGVVYGDKPNQIFIARPSKHTVNEYGFSPLVLPEFNLKETPDKMVEETAIHRVCDISTDGGLVNKLVGLICIPRQKMSEEQNEFLKHGGHPELVDETSGGLGKSALKGFKKYIGEGPVDGCIANLASHFSTKLPLAAENEILDLATGRIAAMQGDYKVTRKEGTWHLEAKNINTKMSDAGKQAL